jgi:hypothetical protein
MMTIFALAAELNGCAFGRGERLLKGSKSRPAGHVLRQENALDKFSNR